MFLRSNLNGGAPAPLLVNPAPKQCTGMVFFNFIVFFVGIGSQIVISFLTETCSRPLKVFLVGLSFWTLLTAFQFLHLSLMQRGSDSQWAFALALLALSTSVEFVLVCWGTIMVVQSSNVFGVSPSSAMLIQVNQCVECISPEGLVRSDFVCEVEDSCNQWSRIQKLDDCPPITGDILCELAFICMNQAPVTYWISFILCVIYLFLLGTTSFLMFGKFIPSLVEQNREFKNLS